MYFSDCCNSLVLSEKYRTDLKVEFHNIKNVFCHEIGRKDQLKIGLNKSHEIIIVHNLWPILHQKLRVCGRRFFNFRSLRLFF